MLIFRSREEVRRGDLEGLREALYLPRRLKWICPDLSGALGPNPSLAQFPGEGIDIPREAPFPTPSRPLGRKDTRRSPPGNRTNTLDRPREPDSHPWHISADARTRLSPHSDPFDVQGLAVIGHRLLAADGLKLMDHFFESQLAGLIPLPQFMQAPGRLPHPRDRRL